MDHIREQCEGTNFPSSNKPGEFSGWFQASVRKSLNARRGSIDKFKQDTGGFGEYSSHSQITYKTDGYAEGFRVDLEHVPGIVTSIIESKFSSNLSSAIKERQSKGHIRDLAKVYDLSPTGDVDYAPTYVLVTNSQYTGNSANPLDSGIEGLGPYGEGQEDDLPTYAKDRGVNMMHLRVTKDYSGGFHLEGDLIGSPADPYRWAKDFVSNEKLPFVVSCSKETT